MLRSPPGKVGQGETMRGEGASATVFGHDKRCPLTSDIDGVVSRRKGEVQKTKIPWD